MVNHDVELSCQTMEDLYKVIHNLNLEPTAVTFDVSESYGFWEPIASFHSPKYSDKEFNDLVLKHRRDLHEYNKWAEANSEVLADVKLRRDTKRKAERRTRLLADKKKIDDQLKKLDQ